MRRMKNTKDTGVDETHTCIKKRNKNLQTRAENAEQESESRVTSRNRLPRLSDYTGFINDMIGWRVLRVTITHGCLKRVNYDTPMNDGALRSHRDVAES